MACPSREITGAAMRATLTDENLAEEIRKWMTARGKTLSTAESCTSGRVAATLTSVSGASEYFQGGVVVYQNELKERFLDVKAETIEAHDVVSQQVVTEMVKGCLNLFHTDFALATTGYTGGGSERVPSGTIWLGWGCADSIRTHCLNLSGTREENTSQAAETLVRLFWEGVGC